MKEQQEKIRVLDPHIILILFISAFVFGIGMLMIFLERKEIRAEGYEFIFFSVEILMLLLILYYMRTVVLSREGCTVSWLFWKRNYKWEELAVIREDVWYTYGKGGSIRYQGIVFSKYAVNKKKKKYNKFFSYIGQDRSDRNFSYKDFSYSESYNTRFTRSRFMGNDFHRAHIKYCGFNGCIFKFVEFKSVNFRGCRFMGATFENVVFYNCSLSKTHFKGAIFKNVYFVNTGIKQVYGLNVDDINIVNEKKIEIELERDLQETIKACEKNEYIVKSKTIVSSGGKINKLSIKRLLDVYEEKVIINALQMAIKGIDKEFSSLSYFVPYLERAKKNM